MKSDAIGCVYLASPFMQTVVQIQIRLDDFYVGQHKDICFQKCRISLILLG